MADVGIKRIPRIDVIDNGTPAGTRPAINLIAGTNVTLTISDDPANNRVNVTIDATSGGGTPAGSDTQIQYNNSGAFGASSKLTWDNVAITMSLGDAGDTSYLSTLSGGTGVNGGSLYVKTGDGTTNAAGDLFFTAGNSVDGNGGAISVSSGNSTNANGGNFNFTAGYSETAGNGGNLEIYGGYSENGNAGNVRIFGGDGNDGTPGNIYLQPGMESATATNGYLILVNLPTSDPGIPGAVWCDTGAGNVLKMS